MSFYGTQPLAVQMFIETSGKRAVIYSVLQLGS